MHSEPLSHYDQTLPDPLRNPVDPDRRLHERQRSEATWPWQGSSGPWRGYYFTHIGGSLRVPFIIRWPGRIAAGRVSNEILHEVDPLTTLARVAGASVPQDRPMDGVDQTDFLLGESDKSAHEGFPVIVADLAGRIRVRF